VQLVTRAWDHGLLRERRGFDIVHAPAFAFPKTRSQLVVTVHGVEWRDPNTRAPERARTWHERALARAVKQGALLLASSSALATQLRSEGVPRVTTLDGPLYGCDHLPAPDDAGADELLAGLGVGDRFVLSVGTLEPRKNLPRLVEAYQRVRATLACPLLLVGPKGWGPGLAPAEGVVLAGAVDDAVLAALYRRATGVAYVPLHEGYGLPAVEAMHAGAAVLASPVPSVGAAALLVDPTDVGDIADGLVRLTTDGARRDELIARGAAHVAELTWAKAAARHAGLWRQMYRGTR
jgi:glycosyltransferase involved in cell wall biosynthesis